MKQLLFSPRCKLKGLPFSSFVIFPSLSFEELQCKHFNNRKKLSTSAWHNLCKMTKGSEPLIIKHLKTGKRKKKKIKIAKRQGLHLDKTPIMASFIAFPRMRGSGFQPIYSLDKWNPQEWAQLLCKSSHTTLTKPLTSMGLFFKTLKWELEKAIKVLEMQK